MPPSPTPPPRPKRFIACMGDAHDPDAWSAIPYHLLECGMRLGALDDGISLFPQKRRYRTRRIFWNGLKVLTGRGQGGFQYSPGFLESLWSPVRAKIKNSLIISTFQLYPASIVADPSVAKCFYMDGTLQQLQDYYKVPVPKSTMADAIRRETEGFRAAKYIFTMSQFAADSVLSDYKIDPAKVFVVPPGANLSPAKYAEWAQQQTQSGRQPSDQLKIITIAKDWKRKGVDRLIRAMRIGQTRGLKATLRIVGCRAEELPEDLRITPNVEWFGFLSRRNDERRFLEVLTECNLGILLSHAELAGIALREYLALGIVALGAKTGGSPDQLDPESSICLAPDASDELVAGVFLDLENNPAKFRALQDAAWRNREQALWNSSVAKIDAVLSGKTEHASP